MKDPVRLQHLLGRASQRTQSSSERVDRAAAGLGEAMTSHDQVAIKARQLEYDVATAVFDGWAKPPGPPAPPTGPPRHAEHHGSGQRSLRSDGPVDQGPRSSHRRPCCGDPGPHLGNSHCLSDGSAANSPQMSAAEVARRRWPGDSLTPCLNSTGRRPEQSPR